RNLVLLSAKGREIALAIQDQYTDVTNAIEEAAAQTRHDLWKAMAEWEYLLAQKPLFRRVQEQKKKRESSQVSIINYNASYQQAFRQLNEEWISHWFTMEPADYKALDDPQGYILDKGGAILVAILNNQPVGVCALIKMNDGVYDFELAKMAVAPAARGKNIGYLLGRAIIDKARSLGARKLYLESNTILAPAIRLYHKLGFTKVAGHPTPYERCNIQMALQVD
ncbi:MAG TPA: GNAT family N-acetyltransferase, partial [Chitinophagaceae bacterium]|nr:GNAT family N-acetyltransferase [Chitinophagaceae bacterium]